MKSKGLQPRLLYSVRLSVKMEGEIRSFSDKRSLKEYTSPNQHYKTCQRDYYKKMKENSERNTSTKRGRERRNISLITLKVNGLNAPITRQRVAEWIRRHDPHIC